MSERSKLPTRPGGSAAGSLDRQGDEPEAGVRKGPRFDASRHCGAHLKNCPTCSVDGMDGTVHWADCPHVHETATCSDLDHRCRLTKGRGTDHPGAGRCRAHGGNTPNGEIQGHREAAEMALERLGVPIARDPQRALMELVWEALGNVAFLRGQCAAMGVSLTIRTSEVAKRPTDVFEEDAEGNTVNAAIGGHLVTTHEEVRAVVKLYGEWSDRLAKYAKAAVDAGVATREIELAEREADLVVRVIEATLAGLGLDTEQQERGRSIAASELRLLAASHPERN